MSKKITSKSAVVAGKPETNKLSGLVEVVGTEKSEHLKKGQVYEVSPQLAETLVKQGYANYKK